MSKKMVYLCGPISGYSYGEVTDWREKVGIELNEVGIDVLSPMRGKKFLAKETSIGDHYANHHLATGKAITTRDRYDTLRADLIISNFLGAKKPSIGSIIEFGWADAKRIPVIMIMEPEGNPHDHSMMKEIAGWIVPTLEDAINLAKLILVPGV